MVLELQSADRMGHILDGIGLAMGEVVHRINGPFVAGAVVGFFKNPVENRVAEIQVWRGHVYLGPERTFARLKITGPHAP